ncbi:MAG: hypothetical protein NTZ26_08545 [Candidatus Aminicenantes bacterium]|nr:hypothetical protein [Candidatus Aminicenantes bacterium]
MTPTPADLFRRFPAPEDFARAVRRLEGDFPFDTAAMTDLGKAYFEAHPDSAGGRDLEAVRIGYAIVRICAVERAVRALNPVGRDFYHAVFAQPARVRELIAARLGSGDAGAAERLQAELAAVGEALDVIRAEIEAIPKGMIKERFVGGISLLTNGLYLVQTYLRRTGPLGGGG